VENFGCGVERGKRGLTQAVVLRRAFSMRMPEKGKLLLQVTPIRTGEGLKSLRGCPSSTDRIALSTLRRRLENCCTRGSMASSRGRCIVYCILLGFETDASQLTEVFNSYHVQMNNSMCPDQPTNAGNRTPSPVASADLPSFYTIWIPDTLDLGSQKRYRTNFLTPLGQLLNHPYAGGVCA
jgi:hypothetical protein